MQSNSVEAFKALADYDVGVAYGPAYMGVPLDFLFLGIILSQIVYWKMTGGDKESWPRRALVYYLLVANLAHTGVNIAFGLHVFVYNRNNPAPFASAGMLKGAMSAEVYAVMPIEVFYAIRAWKLWGKPKIMAIGFGALWLSCVALGIADEVLSSPDAMEISLGPMFLPWCITIVLLDCSISASICLGLWRFRTDTLYGNRLLKKLIIISAEAQLIPSFITLWLIVKCVAVPYNTAVNSFVFTFVGGPKIWTITCLIVINSRHVLRQLVEGERIERQSDLNTIEQGGSVVTPAQSGSEKPMVLLPYSGSPSPSPSRPTFLRGYSSSSAAYGAAYPSVAGDLEIGYVPRPPTGKSQTASGKGEPMSFLDMLGEEK